MAKYFSMDGYVCGEIETRTTASGHTVTKFSVNSPERRQNDGEWETIPNFFDCQYWHSGERDYREGFIRDKAHLQISGEPRMEQWERDGQKRKRIRFNVKELFLIAPKGTAPAPEPEPAQEASVYDDDIPF